MYIGSWKINDYLAFTVNTHTPSTGAVTDADAVPTYRIYEDETGTAIDTGSTAKLDDAGTTGFYSEQVQLLAATGYEKGKTYTIRMSATVGGVTGAMSHTFQIEAEVDANVVSATSVATAAALATAQTDLDTITGSDGVTLATAQALYAPNKVVPDVAGTAATLHGVTDGKVDVVDGIVDNILIDTAVIGALGAGLTAIPWNAAWDAEVQSECADALTAYDPPTRTEATTDKDAIITEVNANETKIDANQVDLDAILLDTGTTIPGTITTMQGNVTDILLDTGTTIPGTITTLQTDATAIKAKTDNLPSGIKKNTAYTAYTFLMVDSTDHVTAKTGLTVAGSYTGDGGAVTALTNTAAITEISNGLYEIDITAGEFNYNNIHLIFTASGADARVIGIHTST